jgi:hypothetical protein
VEIELEALDLPPVILAKNAQSGLPDLQSGWKAPGRGHAQEASGIVAARMTGTFFDPAY